MKKILALLLVFASLFAFAACGEDNENEDNTKRREVLHKDQNNDKYNGYTKEDEAKIDIELNVSETESDKDLVSMVEASKKAEYESRVEASIKHEDFIYEDKKDTLESLGKTEKDKRIVFISDGEYPGMKVGYEVISFDENGKYSGWKQYVYYPDVESFDQAVANVGNSTKFAYESSDASLRLIVLNYTENAYLANETYDTLLKNVQDFGYTLVE